MLTVAFASYNGADTLPLMLDALTRMTAPPGGWRLIAVDNASTDDTHQLLMSYRDRLPLTVLQQPAPGKSKALNLALEHVEGDLLVLTDDDVLPAPDWLETWRGYADAHPEFGMFGGLIRPHWLQPPPDWLAGAIPLGIAYGMTRAGLRSGEVDPLYIAGPNMAVRIAAIREGLRFDESRGPSGNNYAMGEDTRFAYAAHERGHAAAHCPQAVVGHIVQPEQYTKHWLMDRAFHYGQSRGLEDALFDNNSGSAHWLGMPRWMLRERLKQELLALSRLVGGNRMAHMDAAWEARFLRGYLAAYRQQAGQSREDAR